MPYEFTKYDYKTLYPQIFYSEKAQRFYIVHKNRKIYMKKGMNKEQTARCINALLREQDKESAHCYRLDELELTGDEVVVDAGIAEGFVTTELLDRVKKIYAFDINPDWLDALKWTFADTDTVVVVPKGLGETVSEGFTTLDEYFKGEKVDLIKADIDSPGAECEMARGGVETFRNAKKAIICTYHHQNDAHEMKKFFEELGFATKFSKGFALRGEVPSRYKTDLQPPYLRRGVIYATKE